MVFFDTFRLVWVKLLFIWQILMIMWILPVCNIIVICRGPSRTFMAFEPTAIPIDFATPLLIWYKNLSIFVHQMSTTKFAYKKSGQFGSITEEKWIWKQDDKTLERLESGSSRIIFSLTRFPIFIKINLERYSKYWTKQNGVFWHFYARLGQATVYMAYSHDYVNPSNK